MKVETLFIGTPSQSSMQALQGSDSRSSWFERLGKDVRHPRLQGTEADLLREKEEVQKKVELERIEIEKRNAEELLTKWQTANLVLQAFGTFVWPLISDEDRNELVKYGMTNFHDICSVKRRRTDSAERRLARQVYLKIDEDVRFLGEEIIGSKQQLRDERHMLALPTISDTQLKAYLEDLGDGVPTLKLIEMDAFNYLKVTTNTQANIEASRRWHRDSSTLSLISLI